MFGHAHADLQFAVVLHGIHAGRHHAVQIDGCERHRIGAGVVQELVDGGIELHDVGHHVFAGHVVGHAHFGFQAQASQRGAQVMRDAGEHDGTVLLELGEFLRHAVEADVHLADFAGHGLFVELAGREVAILDAVGGIGQLLERSVDQPRDHGGSGERQGACGNQPDQPGLATGGRQARAVHQQPVRVAVDGETHP
ncbi:hypothetical protein SDC9_121475 [bioreactor metagenome]|uniref:Uncharacterized protein n=1 Tax=bioreactor metagenome TaxID=1076179 RepID=A0A645CC21_9ZZZZ